MSDVSQVLQCNRSKTINGAFVSFAGHRGGLQGCTAESGNQYFLNIFKYVMYLVDLYEAPGLYETLNERYGVNDKTTTVERL